MRFLDIPQYPRAHYQVHVSLDYLAEHIRGYAESYGFTMDPEYQRGHVWTMEQRERYVEHVLAGGETALDIIINVRNWNKPSAGKEGVAEVLDGKQRLTALLMFMRDEVRAFGLLYSEFEGKPRRSHIVWKVVDFDEVDVLRHYVMLNAGGTVHTQDEIERVRALIAAKESAR
jgi:hypothetical protein